MTMRVDLLELLSTNPIAHPTRIERATICQGRLELLVAGWVWWSAAVAGADEQQVTLGFERLSSGELPVCLRDESYNEDLEDFSIRPLVGVEWAQPESNSVYCYAPLTDPAAVYARLQSYLYGVGSFKGPGDFLNNGETLSRFAKLTSGRSYQVARGPDVISDLVCQELGAQGVPHNVLTNRLPAEDRLWVKLNGSSFLCQSAWADLPP